MTMKDPEGQRKSAMSCMIDTIRHVIQEDGRITVREISELFDLSISTTHSIWTENLTLEHLSVRWVPRLLIDDET